MPCRRACSWPTFGRRNSCLPSRRKSDGRRLASASLCRCAPDFLFFHALSRLALPASKAARSANSPKKRTSKSAFLRTGIQIRTSRAKRVRSHGRCHTETVSHGGMGCTLQPATQVEEKEDDAMAQNGGGGREMDDTATAVSGLPFKGTVPARRPRYVRHSGASFVSRNSSHAPRPSPTLAAPFSLPAQRTQRRTSLKRSSLRT